MFTDPFNNSSVGNWHNYSRYIARSFFRAFE